MGLIIDSGEDFNYGKFLINDNDYTRQNLGEYIDQQELSILYALLGVELTNLFVADLDDESIPQSDRFLSIYDQFAYNRHNGSLVVSKGLKELLKGFIFFEFTRDQNSKNNINGNSQNIYDSGDLVTAEKNGIYQKYNLSVDDYQAIQTYIHDNISIYPEYLGIKKEGTSIF